MADTHTKRLGRLLRVRTLQVGQVRAEESAAQDKLASEHALSQRIAALAANVAPRPAEFGAAMSFAAAAHYRERLHTSSAAAAQRVMVAEAGLNRARAATQEARRDQSAIEKLVERAKLEAAKRELRALEETPPARRNRHAPC